MIHCSPPRAHPPVNILITSEPSAVFLGISQGARCRGAFRLGGQVVGFFRWATTRGVVQTRCSLEEHGGRRRGSADWMPWDTPGRPGKDQGRLVALVPLRAMRTASLRRQHSPVSRMAVARHPKRLRNCGASLGQNHEAGPVRRASRVGRAQVAVTHEVHGCYCAPARVRWLWRESRPTIVTRPTKTGESRTKGARDSGGPRVRAGRGNHLRNAGDPRGDRWPVSQRQPER